MKVTMHKASDGSLHTTMTACKQHEDGLKVAKAVEAATFDLGAFGGHPDNAAINRLFSDAVIANAGILRKLLVEATITRKPRKVKAPIQVPTPVFSVGDNLFIAH